MDLANLIFLLSGWFFFTFGMKLKNEYNLSLNNKENIYKYNCNIYVIEEKMRERG